MPRGTPRRTEVGSSERLRAAVEALARRAPEAARDDPAVLVRAAGHAIVARAAGALVPGAGALFPPSALKLRRPPAVAFARLDDLASAYAALLAHRPEPGPDGRVTLVPDREGRRAAGAFYTPPDLVERLLARALDPLVAAARSPAALRVCDPACGAGALLVAAGARLRAAGVRPSTAYGDCLAGVDADPVAVGLTRTSLVAAGAEPELVVERIVLGDALTGPAFDDDRERWPALDGALDWTAAYPTAAADGGFDLVLGNPPWIAHAGRAARPLPAPVRALHRRRSAAFSRYPTTHGLFVERAAALVRPRGRVALVLPTSVADLDGYRPARAAHDARCDPEPDLPDFGDGRFGPVFQPAMGLVSVRRPGGRRGAPGDPWPLERPDLAPPERALLARLAALPTLPAHLFGERGLQTDTASRGALVAVADAPPGAVPIREGLDVRAFAAGAPRLAVDPALVRAGRLEGVALLVRQTARRPIAALADGMAFRNSLLAGFVDGAWPAGLLVALLNSSLVAWHHERRFRDARQGMPQVKIAHLRAIPAPPLLDGVRFELAALGAELGRRNTGLDDAEQTALDRLVARAYGLDASEAVLVGRVVQRGG